MVFKPSQVGVGRIEMFDTREGAGVSTKLAILKKNEKRVIRLTECLSVTPAPGETCPAGCTAFYLNTAQRIFMLAAPTQEEWVPALCALAFQVIPPPPPHTHTKKGRTLKIQPCAFKVTIMRFQSHLRGRVLL